MSNIDFTEFFAFCNFHDTDFIDWFNDEVNDMKRDMEREEARREIEEARHDMQERYKNRSFIFHITALENARNNNLDFEWHGNLLPSDRGNNNTIFNIQPPVPIDFQPIDIDLGNIVFE